MKAQSTQLCVCPGGGVEGGLPQFSKNHLCINAFFARLLRKLQLLSPAPSEEPWEDMV